MNNLKHNQSSEEQKKSFKEFKTLEDSRWLAKRLGISWEKARAMGRNNELPCIRIGKLIKYSPEIIDQWVRENTIEPEVKFGKSNSKNR